LVALRVAGLAIHWQLPMQQTKTTVSELMF